MDQSQLLHTIEIAILQRPGPGTSRHTWSSFLYDSPVGQPKLMISSDAIRISIPLSFISNFSLFDWFRKYRNDSINIGYYSFISEKFSYFVIEYS